MVPYHHVTVYSAKLEAYVLKIHGQGWYDMYIQLPTLTSLNTWQQCFNQKRPDYHDPIQQKSTDPPIESAFSHDLLLQNN